MILRLKHGTTAYRYLNRTFWLIEVNLILKNKSIKTLTLFLSTSRIFFPESVPRDAKEKAIMAPICTSGASGPSANPEVTPHTVPMILVMSVCIRSASEVNI